jgi:hypothetical protein
MGRFPLLFQSLAPEVWVNRVKRATFRGMKELVAQIFQALALIAGLLWSGVCAAECRILPELGQKAQSAQRELPPCHKQQHDESHSKNLSSPSCSAASEEVAQKQLQLPDFTTVQWLDSDLSPSLFAITGEAGPVLADQSQAPPSSIRILRV